MPPSILMGNLDGCRNRYLTCRNTQRLPDPIQRYSQLRHPSRVVTANSQDRIMDKLGTWLAISAVAVGFIVLVWLLFADNPQESKKKKTKK